MDADGYMILNGMREHCSKLESFLMDKEVLEVVDKEFIVKDSGSLFCDDFKWLSKKEEEAFGSLCQPDGSCIRIEQEAIPEQFVKQYISDMF